MLYNRESLIGKAVFVDGVDVTELGVWEADTGRGFVKVRRAKAGTKVNVRSHEVFKKKGKVEVKDKPTFQMAPAKKGEIKPDPKPTPPSTVGPVSKPIAPSTVGEPSKPIAPSTVKEAPKVIEPEKK